MCLKNLRVSCKQSLCLRDIYYSKDALVFVKLFRDYFSNYVW